MTQAAVAAASRCSRMKAKIVTMNHRRFCFTDAKMLRMNEESANKKTNQAIPEPIEWAVSK